MKSASSYDRLSPIDVPRLENVSYYAKTPYLSNQPVNAKFISNWLVFRYIKLHPKIEAFKVIKNVICEL